MNVIEVKNLSKQYDLSTLKSSGKATLREEIDNFCGQLIGHKKQKPHEKIWALKDVNFSVKKGEAVGVLGVNGSGKSTLLKILSRVVTPTSGEAVLCGKVRSILEVGIGFHTELTGRENVEMSGMILGMPRHIVEEKFQEIVNFSGVEKYLDVPVKYYSSGMMVRLAFSVIAHMSPDIMLVDEALAVGDAEFQEKCILKMREMVASGTTLLLVSHNIEQVRIICNRALVINAGHLVMDDGITKSADYYLQEIANLHKL